MGKYVMQIEKNAALTECCCVNTGCGRCVDEKDKAMSLAVAGFLLKLAGILFITPKQQNREHKKHAYRT